ncbi:MAG: glutamate synthase-related protein [Thermodesulfobacteriota bacterium]
MPHKFFLHPKPAASRFISPGPFGIIEGPGCLNCANCVKKNCPYDVFQKRKFNEHDLWDTADSLCRNCFRCVQSCYGKILAKTANPEYWQQGDDYWLPEIIASNRAQAETGRIPVSGGGYGGPFAGPGFDSMWTDMSEIVRPTRDGIHGREYISTAIDLGKNPGPFIWNDNGLEDGQIFNEPQTHLEISLPLIFDLLPLQFRPLPPLKAIAQGTKEINTLLILKAKEISEELRPFAPWLIPYMDALNKDYSRLISLTRMVQIPYQNKQKTLEISKEIKKVNPQIIVAIRMTLHRQVEADVLDIIEMGGEVIHLMADEKGKEHGSDHSLFLKDLIRQIHLRLIQEKCRDRVTLIFGGGIALAEHMAKAIICGADSVSLDLPLLLAWECRLCRRCLQGRSCPVEIEKAEPAWGRQRIINLMAAWHGQILEVLGAMGLRDVRRLRGESGRAIFLEEVEEETMAKIFRRVHQGREVREKDYAFSPATS